MEVNKNEIVCIIGPSGCGKSTLLNIISGLLKPSVGEVINGSGAISYVFQEDRLLPWKNAYENIKIVNKKCSRERCLELIEKVGLMGFAGYYPSELSGGMRQRCSIARAFNYEADLLLMDEPFKSLDYNLRIEMTKYLLELWESTKKSIVFVTHEIDETLLLGDRILVLSDRPTKVIKEFNINIPKTERRLTDNDLVIVRNGIINLLQSKEADLSCLDRRLNNMPKTKGFILKRFSPYMGKKKVFLPLSLALSGISAVLNILPFVLVWYITREILSAPQAIDVYNVSYYAWLAFSSAIGGIAVYFFALLFSHLAAFHVEVGMQKKGMEDILSMPSGFFDQHSSGKIRKIVNDGAGTTHTFLAHQLPDMAGSVVSPIILIALIFIVEWRMGLASFVPIILGFITMRFMMSTEGKKFQKMFYDSLEEMSSESVEYIRGIPVVKTFGQSIFSFKRFSDSIIRYKEMVCAFILLWQKPMSFYGTAMQSAAFFLIPMAIFLIGREEQLPLVLADFVFYILISPIFTTLLMKSKHFQHNILIAE